MTARLALPTPQFAVWVRRTRLRLPYPLDITAVPGAGVTEPDPESTELRTLVDILTAPRVSAFGLRTLPDETASSYLAVAAAEDALLLTIDANTTALASVADTELALSIVTALPTATEMAMEATELPEPEWNRLAALARLDEPGELDEVVEQFAEVRLPRRLAVAMAAAAAEPVPIGVLGASAWAGRAEKLGPRLAAWYEYPSGAVLTERVPAHGRTGPVIRVGPLTQESAFRALAAAIGDAVHAVAAATAGEHANGL